MSSFCYKRFIESHSDIENASCSNLENAILRVVSFVYKYKYKYVYIFVYIEVSFADFSIIHEIKVVLTMIHLYTAMQSKHSG